MTTILLAIAFLGATVPPHAPTTSVTQGPNPYWAYTVSAAQVSVQPTMWFSAVINVKDDDTDESNQTVDHCSYCDAEIYDLQSCTEYTALAYNGHGSHTQGGGGKSWSHSKKAKAYVEGQSNVYYDRYKAVDNAASIYKDETEGYVIFTQTVTVTKPAGGG